MVRPKPCTNRKTNNQMKKALAIALASLCCISAQADQEFLGLYMSGSKIGHSSYDTHPDMLGDRKLNRTDSNTVMDTALLGQSLKIEMQGSSWVTSEGRPVKMLFQMSSAGRTQKITVVFTAKTAEVDIDNEAGGAGGSVPSSRRGRVCRITSWRLLPARHRQPQAHGLMLPSHGRLWSAKTQTAPAFDPGSEVDARASRP